jgi:S-adenosyl methyltransferase
MASLDLHLGLADADVNQAEVNRRQDQHPGARHPRTLERGRPVDDERPSTSRVYDYFLGGENHFAADRALAARLAESLPDIGAIMRENRAFLHRAVTFLLDAGIHQFLDLGSGIPNVSNVHQVAQRRDHHARVVYVDIDPTAVDRSRRLLAGNADAAVIRADFRDPPAVLDHPEVQRLIDLSAPVAILILGVLHDLPDSDDPAGILAQFRDRLVPGSFLALTQGSTGVRRDTGSQATSAYNVGYAGGAPRLTLRDRAQTLTFFTGFDLVAPGLVFVEDWRPDLPSAPDSDPRAAASAIPGHRAALGGIGLR